MTAWCIFSRMKLRKNTDTQIRSSVCYFFIYSLHYILWISHIAPDWRQAIGLKNAVEDGKKKEGKLVKLEKGMVCKKAFRTKNWLVNGCQPGDWPLFHFSGHGSRQKNRNGDEIDGYDETLCPLDFETEGMIIDDEINAVMPKNTSLRWFVSQLVVM